MILGFAAMHLAANGGVFRVFTVCCMHLAANGGAAVGAFEQRAPVGRQVPRDHQAARARYALHNRERVTYAARCIAVNCLQSQCASNSWLR